MQSESCQCLINIFPLAINSIFLIQYILSPASLEKSAWKHGLKMPSQYWFHPFNQGMRPFKSLKKKKKFHFIVHFFSWHFRLSEANGYSMKEHMWSASRLQFLNWKATFFLMPGWEDQWRLRSKAKPLNVESDFYDLPPYPCFLLNNPFLSTHLTFPLWH